MQKSPAPLLLAFLLSTAVLGQFNPQLNAGTPGISSGSSAFNGSRLCNRNFADANASGIYTFDPDLSNGQSLQPIINGTQNPVSWATTVYQSPNTTASDSLTELSLWFSPQGNNYSNSFALGYDACYLWISSLNLNSFERGQNDNGTCLETLDETCVNDLQNSATQYATWLVGNPTPGPNSNLTAGSLPTVCGDIASSLTNNFPKSCEVFFNQTRTVYGAAPALGGPLTGNSSYVDRAFCKMNGSYSMMWSQYGPPTMTNYLVANYWVTPLITVWMPIADYLRPATVAGAKSFTSCLRAKNLNAGSEAIPTAPSPTPINTGDASNSTTASNSTSNSSGTPAASNSSNAAGSSSGLSGGAIAGIVVGVVLGLAAIAALIMLLFRKRIQESMEKRRRARRSIAELDGGVGYVEMDRKVPPVEMSGHTAAEMDSSNTRAELGDHKEWVSEMATHREPQAINQHPAELG